jgi:hypothetical protein
MSQRYLDAAASGRRLSLAPKLVAAEQDEQATFSARMFDRDPDGRGGPGGTALQYVCGTIRYLDRRRQVPPGTGSAGCSPLPQLASGAGEHRGRSNDDDLTKFEAHGAAPLPPAEAEGRVEHEGARIWYAAYGSGAPMILLHGALGRLSRNLGADGTCTLVTNLRQR